MTDDRQLLMNANTRGKLRLLGLLYAALAFPVGARHGVPLLSALGLPGEAGLSAAAGQGASSNASPWDWPERDRWQRPEEVMNELRLRAGSQVADVGCGSGYFTYHLAHRVGPQGKVYAEDIQPNLIRSLWHQALSKWLVQVRPVLGEEDNPHLPPQRLDAILLVLSYHEMRPHEAMVKAFYRALRPGGFLGIIEFEGPDNQPREDAYKHHQIPARTVREEITAQGFKFVRNEPSFKIRGASWERNQYFLLFEKPEEDRP
jgi:predicted methyltransferase